jgi:hypothetical protein
MPGSPASADAQEVCVQRPRIVQVNYHEFQQALQRAGDTGSRIEPADKVRWVEWVKGHDIKEAAFRTVGSNQFEGLVPVIIDDSSSWAGYYLYSVIEEACLKWEVVVPGPAI